LQFVKFPPYRVRLVSGEVSAAPAAGSCITSNLHSRPFFSFCGQNSRKHNRKHTEK
jgi:hypothetical protein